MQEEAREIVRALCPIALTVLWTARLTLPKHSCFGRALWNASLYAICQEATGILHPTVIPADLSQMSVNADPWSQTKNGPGNRGHLFKPSQACRSSDRAPSAQVLYFSGSETEIGEIAVADGNAAAGGQQAVDGSSLGHFVPFRR